MVAKLFFEPKIHLKVNLHCFKLELFHILHILINFRKFVKCLAKFSGLNSKGPYLSLEKEKRNFLCFVHLLCKAGASKQEVSCRSRARMAKKCTKKRGARAKLLFYYYVNLLLFCHSPSLLFPFVVIQKFCYHAW